MRLPIRFTETFAELYDALPSRDVPVIDRMLDELDHAHDQPHMRNILRLGEHSLYATPRMSAPNGLYRITWCYDDRDDPNEIVCITVATIET